jgi:catechol 2,3-dioxygenase-like lactoylglutathione lyase family enzyme
MRLNRTEPMVCAPVAGGGLLILQQKNSKRPPIARPSAAIDNAPAMWRISRRRRAPPANPCAAIVPSVKRIAIIAAIPRPGSAEREEGRMDAIDKIDGATAEGAAQGGTAGPLGALPERLHHHAYVVRDHEANRHFLEDVLGIPLVATWCEKSWRAEVGREVEYCHTFFGLADGGALAFFQFADPEIYALTQAEKPKIASHYHIALKVGEGTYDELKHRLDRAGETFRETDHGYCKSIYMRTPDGMILEFTCDPPDAAEIDRLRRADAHSELARWLGGDRRVNNELRHREQ